MAVAGGAQRDLVAARTAAARALDDGRALERFVRMVRAQGGDPSVIEHPERLPRARVVVECRARRAGIVETIRPRELGRGVVELGGGRRALGDAVDPAVGFVLHVTPGDRIEVGDVLGEVHASAAGDEIGRAHV